MATPVIECKDIPMPVVLLNRWTLFLGVILATVLQQPLIILGLFAVLLPATLFGQKGSLIFQIGIRVFARQCATAHQEDRRLQRFNNSIATILLGLAVISFAFSWSVAGWLFAGMVAVAAGIALAGFCVGCFVYYQFKLQRYRLFGSK